MGELTLIIRQDKEEMEAAEVFVDGTVGGNPYRFLLDTGAGMSCIMYDDYTAGFPSAEKRDSSGVFAKSSDDLIIVPSIEVGAISKQNCTIIRTAETNPHIKNLIGMNLLKDYCLHFYFDENRVSVDANDGFAGKTLDLFVDPKYHPYVDVGFGNLNAKSVWDTGASITVVDMGFISKYPTFFKEVGQSEGTDATGYTMQTPIYLMAQTVIGSYRFPPHKVAGVDLSQANATLETPMDLILGYNTWSKAHWWFDFPRKKWAITKFLI